MNIGPWWGNFSEEEKRHFFIFAWSPYIPKEQTIFLKHEDVLAHFEHELEKNPYCDVCKRIVSKLKVSK